MKAKNFEEYCNEFIKFYKELKTCGWTKEQLQNQIVRNLHNIKNAGLKFIEKSKTEAINEVDNFFRENYMEEDELSVGVVQDVIEEYFLGEEQ